MQTPIAFIQNLDAPEVIMILCVVLLFFGAKRMPELARSFGKSVREFKKATSGFEEDIRTAMDSDAAPKQASVKPGALAPEASKEAKQA